MHQAIVSSYEDGDSFNNDDTTIADNTITTITTESENDNVCLMHGDPKLLN